jgi:hypothetical protein
VERALVSWKPVNRLCTLRESRLLIYSAAAAATSSLYTRSLGCAPHPTTSWPRVPRLACLPSRQSMLTLQHSESLRRPCLPPAGCTAGSAIGGQVPWLLLHSSLLGGVAHGEGVASGPSGPAVLPDDGRRLRHHDASWTCTDVGEGPVHTLRYVAVFFEGSGAVILLLLLGGHVGFTLAAVSTKSLRVPTRACITTRKPC